MDVSAPHTAICPTLDSAVLVKLAGTTRPLTGREVARLLERRSHRGVLDALNRLVEQGIVDRAEAGRAFLFSLNREHLAAPAVELLAELRAELLSRLTERVRTWSVAPLHASLFGSAARGDGNARSDIDLFLVRPPGVADDESAWTAQRDDLALRVRRWTGNAASIAEVSQADLNRLRLARPRIAEELERDAVVFLGPPITELLGAAP